MFEKKTGKNLIVKANQLMEAKFKFKLWEMRIFEKMVSLIDKNETEFKLCRIYIAELIEYFNSRSNNDHELIRQAANSLGDKKLYAPYYTKQGQKRWAKLTIFPTITTPDAADRGGDNAYVELEFHKDLKPFLLDLKRHFKSYDLQNIRFLKSVYSIRMYILLKQYENLTTREFYIDDLKSILAIDQGQYKLYADFKKRVILKPQQELARHCDICFTYEEKKEGRKVVALRFHIKSNTPQRLLEKEKKATIEEIEVVEANLYEELYPTVKAWVSVQTFRKWLADYPETQVRNGIRYTLHQLNQKTEIENIGGYLHTMIKQPTLFDPIQEKKEKAIKNKQKAAHKRQQRQQLEAEYKRLQAELYRKETELANQIFTQNPTAKTKLLAAVKASRFASFDASRSDEENLKNPLFAATFHNAIKKAYATDFETLQEEYRPRIEAVRKAVARA